MADQLAPAIPLDDSVAGMDALLVIGAVEPAGSQSVVPAGADEALAALATDGELDHVIDFFAADGEGPALGGQFADAEGSAFFAGLLDAQVGGGAASMVGPDALQDAALQAEASTHA